MDKLEIYSEDVDKATSIMKEVSREKGIKYISLDTGMNDEKVKQIYLNAGFKIVEVIEECGMALYELEV